MACSNGSQFYIKTALYYNINPFPDMIYAHTRYLTTCYICIVSLRNDIKFSSIIKQ